MLVNTRTIFLAGLALFLALISCSRPEESIHKTNTEIEFGTTKFDSEDPASFQVLGKGYAKDSKHVFYYDKSFQTLSWGFTPQYSYKTFRLKADPNTFQVLHTDFGKDKNFAYYQNNQFRVKDISSFRYMKDQIFVDRFAVYYQNKEIPGLQSESLEILPESPGPDLYVKDKTSVWYIKESFNANSKNKLQMKKVEADPSSFSHLDLDYFFDKDFLYREGKRISKRENSEKLSLKALPGEYRILGTSVFYQSRIVSGADPISFQVLELDIPRYNYARDKNAIYYQEKKIEDCDPSSFSVINENYSKDKNSVYFQGRKINTATASHFELLIPDSCKKTTCFHPCVDSFPERYATDGVSIFYGPVLVKKANLKTFIVNDTCSQASDRHFDYDKGKAKKKK